MIHPCSCAAAPEQEPDALKVACPVLRGGKPVRVYLSRLGYTEAFYTSAGESIGKGLGKLLTVKSNRQRAQNRNRYRLKCHAKNNRKKAANILKNNLGYKTKAKRRAAAQATIKNLIRRDLCRSIQPGTQVYCEDLSYPIKSKTEFKRLNNWMKGAAQDSLIESGNIAIKLYYISVARRKRKNTN